MSSAALPTSGLTAARSSSRSGVDANERRRDRCRISSFQTQGTKVGSSRQPLTLCYAYADGHDSAYPIEPHHQVHHSPWLLYSMTDYGSCKLPGAGAGWKTRHRDAREPEPVACGVQGQIFGFGHSLGRSDSDYLKSLLFTINDLLVRWTRAPS